MIAKVKNADLRNGAGWIAGEIVPISEAKIPVTDWGLTRSDVTYDVVHVWDGAFFRLKDYISRFRKSVESLRLEIVHDDDAIAGILHDLVAASGLRQSYVSMVASRGVPKIPGTRDPRQCENHFYAWAVPFVWVIPSDVAKRGAAIKISQNSERISPQSVDPKVKNYHWGDMTKALFEALDDGYDTAVLPDVDGHITEGPGFNVFSVKDGRVLTPKRGMLEGITRRTVLEICTELGLEAAEADITIEEFLHSDEVFTATTGGGPVPVTRVNSTILGNNAPGPVTLKIKDTYWEWHRRPEHKTAINYT